MKNTENKIYPLLFNPIFRSTIWGGDKILAYRGAGSEKLTYELQGEKIGESWELSGVTGFESVVANGPFKNMPLSRLIAEYKEKLVGGKNYKRFGTKFPLLVKYIDAANDLSIQLHPGEELARSRHNSSGKDEMWYVLQADEGASLMAGFHGEITENEYHKALKENNLASILEKYRIKPHDVFYLPSGCIHSIGAGSFVLEIQQASEDITYRLYDFDRTDKNGKKRELHIDLAEKAIDYSIKGGCKVEREGRDSSLIECEWFTVDSLNILEGTFNYDYSKYDSFVVMICVRGASVIKPGGEERCEPYEDISILQGDVILLPSSLGSVIIEPASEGVDFITVRV